MDLLYTIQLFLGLYTYILQIYKWLDGYFIFLFRYFFFSFNAFYSPRMHIKELEVLKVFYDNADTPHALYRLYGV